MEKTIKVSKLMAQMMKGKGGKLFDSVFLSCPLVLPNPSYDPVSLGFLISLIQILFLFIYFIIYSHFHPFICSIKLNCVGLIVNWGIIVH